MSEAHAWVSPSARPVWDHERWRDLAACLDTDTRTFFPRGSTGPAVIAIHEAKAICARCPVAEECLTFAVATNQEFGVWGGQDEDERRRTRRRWNATRRRK